MTNDEKKAYWKEDIRLVSILLSIWFVVSYGFSILLVAVLDTLPLPGTGFKLGFWFAQQGSIYVFVILIFVYVHLMKKLDRRYKVNED